MCGISARISRQPADQSIDRLTDFQAHRGPDASGVFISESGLVQLGHRRLSILDLSAAGNQPFWSKSRRLVMVYNGEVYNYRELANNYALSLSTGTDTEVIMELFERKGPDFISELNGMFAIVIYDTITHEIHIFRDRMGIKPLYYYSKDDEFIFSSELPPILNLLEKQPIRDDSIGDFLHLGYIPEPYTFYQNIFKFPTGTYGLIKDHHLSKKAYWQAEEYIQANVETSETKVLASLEEILRDAVKLRMRADVPFGTFLSGGADSGLVSALAADLNTEPIHTFNVSFEDASFDETPYAEEMAKIIGSNHHHIKHTKQDVLVNFQAGIGLVGEPFADSSVFPTMAVSDFASKHVKMALSGDGGDELFMGYGAYTWADRLSSPVLWHLRKPIATALRIKGDARSKRAANVFDAPSKTGLQAHIFSQEQNLFSQKEIEKILGKPYTSSYKPAKHARKLSSAEEQAFFDLTHYLKDDLLVKVDRSSMHYGLEVRVPFLDHRLVEYSLNIDPNLKRKNGVDKYLIKKIMERYYPNELIYRQKWGFSIPLEKWLKDGGYFKEMATPNEKIDQSFESFNRMYNSNTTNAWMYNRIYTLQCLSSFLR